MGCKVPLGLHHEDLLVSDTQAKAGSSPPGWAGAAASRASGLASLPASASRVRPGPCACSNLPAPPGPSLLLSPLPECLTVRLSIFEAAVHPAPRKRAARGTSPRGLPALSAQCSPPRPAIAPALLRVALTASLLSALPGMSAS